MLDQSNRGIHIQESAVGSAIVSGDGNTIYVIHQTTPPQPEAPADTPAQLGPNPYKGLAAFTEQDGDRYFGREAQVERLWERFQRLVEQSAVPRLLPILGPSGSGKSSLARAGLIPALAQRPLLGKAQMRVAVLVPGSHPLEALAGVLAKTATQDPMPVTKTREFATELGIATPEGTYDGLRRIASLIPQIQDAPLVVLVDQFEEVYSLCKEAGERQAFIDNLLTAAQDPSAQVSVVITLRSDFLGETQRHPGLNQIIGSDQSVIVPAMTTAELRRAIAEPAKRAGHPLDEATVDLLVTDTEGREGALPLLQFALSRIWEGLAQGVAPAETYRQMGGVGGALAGKAQEIYDHLSPGEQETARRIFIGLVQLGEGTRDTRRRAPVESLIASQDSPEAVKQVLARFSSPGARLVTLASQENQDVAEVTHEALFGHWQQLNDWLDSSRDDIRFQRRLETAAQYWHDQGKPAGLLWRPPDLDLLRSFAQHHQGDMTTLDMSFFTAADQAERQEKRLKRLGTAGLAAGLVLTTTLTGFAGYQVRRAELRQIEIYETNAKNLAESDPLGSMVSGLAAINIGENPLTHFPRIGGGQRLISTAVLDLGNRYAQFTRVIGVHDSGVMQVGTTPDGNPIFGNLGDWVLSVAISPDGETIISGGDFGVVRLWNRSGQSLGQIITGHDGAVNSVAISSDGETVVSGGDDGTMRLWSLSGQSLGQPIIGHDGAVNSVAISSNGETVISGGDDGTVRLWSLSGQSLSQPIIGHDGAVNSVAISSNGETVISGGDDGTVRLWSLSGQSLGQPIIGHDGAVNSVAISSDGETVVSGGTDGTVRLWRLSGQPLGQSIISHDGAVNSVVISSDGEMIGSGGTDGTVRLWNRSGQPLSQPMTGHNGNITSVAISPDGETVVSGGFDGTVRLWDQNSKSLEQPITGHDDWVTSVDISLDGKTVVSGSADSTVRLWDSGGQPLGQPMTGHDEWVRAVAISSDGAIVVSGGSDGTVRLWNRNGQPLGQPLTGHGERVTVAISSDGAIVVSGGSDGTVRLWNRMGEPLGKPMTGHEGWVNAVAISPDGETIVSGGYDGTVRLWDRNGQPLSQPLTGHRGQIYSVAFSPDGETIVSGGHDGTVRLWDRNGQFLSKSLTRHRGWVSSVAVSPDGETIVSGGYDSTIRLWDRSGQPLGQPITGHYGGVNAVVFSPDGKTIVSGSDDGTIRLWPLWLAEVGWVNYTCNRIRGYLVAKSETDETVRVARRTCERSAWR
ncbi:AAA family ATPase [Phormidium sp. FACHB-1136]|uniref:WD40 repeat domain-containing protein n=1 Tax=Phormidium sp. FACHB-1136 TaxID=2692848 RepID=UPI0016892D08|nr:AAA family ATPase [Phormidium sp. FACHB-1136]MBD2426104.1 AAA family ATPase [Phormidium sp. FACHB-1136]